MVLLVTLVVLSLLLVAFLALTVREKAVGTRVFSAGRAHLDTQVSHVVALVTRVHIGLALLHVVETFVRQLVHEVVHLALAVVRVLERVLMRTRARVQKSTLSTRALRARSHFLEMAAKLKGEKKGFSESLSEDTLESDTAKRE